MRKANKVSEAVNVVFGAGVKKAIKQFGAAIHKEKCAADDLAMYREQAADTAARVKGLRGGLTAAMQVSIDALKAEGKAFRTIIRDGKPAMDDKCPVRIAFWDAVNDASFGTFASSSYIAKMKTNFNRVMSGLNESLKDAADEAAGRGEHSTKSKVAKAVEAVGDAPDMVQNPVTDSVPTTWNYIRTAPTHLAMLRSVIVKTESGMGLEAAIESALNEYAKAQSKAKGK